MWKNNGRWFAVLLLLLSALPGLAEQAGTISGTLVDSATGQPIEKAAVTLTPVPARDHLTAVTTGSDGHFEFAGLAGGKYSLQARARGYLSQAFNQHQGYSSAIAVGPGLDPENLTFRLPPECVITGAVSDEAGEPVRGAQVSLYVDSIAAGSREARPAQQEITDDQGGYHFGHLESGEYYIVVSAQVWYAQRPELKIDRTELARLRGRYIGALPDRIRKETAAVPSRNHDSEERRSSLDVVYPITFYPGATDPSSASPITVNPGERFIANVRLQPVPAAHMEIQSSLPGEPGSVYVQLEQKTPWGTFPAPGLANVMNGSGKTLLTGIPPGRYEMKIRETKPTGKEMVRESEVEVGSDGTIEQSADDPPAHVTATVKDSTGTAPAVHGTLQLYNPATREFFYAQIPQSGQVEYAEPIAPGQYVVAVTQSGGAFVKSISGTGAKIAGGMVTVEPGAQAKLLVVLGNGYGRITGTAQKEGKPFAGAMVLLVPDEGANTAVFRRDQSDSDGTFTLNNVVPGKYRVMAIENGWDLEWMKAEVLKKFAGGAVAVDVGTREKLDIKVNVQ